MAIKKKSIHKKKEIFEVQSATAMRSLGADIARSIVALPRPAKAVVITLTGDLGAGKTTFTQGFLKELGVRRRIISPTFLIIRPYDLERTVYTKAYHLDCYRLKKPEELLSLGFKEMLADPHAIILIEWPEIIEHQLPAHTLALMFKHPEKGSHRMVQLSRK